MAFNVNLPADTTAPAEIRENFRALKEDKIVAADTANTADKLATVRTIALTGDATGSASFDGSADVSISVDVTSADNADTVDNCHAGTEANNVLKLDSNGKVPIANLAGFDNSLNSSGYQKLPSGLIIQWGKSNTSNGTVNITFPIPFTSSCYNVSITENAASSWSTSLLTVYGATGISTTGFTTKALSWNGASFVNASGWFNYIAIGK